MKEYWMNVYEGNWLGNRWNKYESAARIFTSETKYRLHVREFETREAKELYQSLVGKSTAYKHNFNDLIYSETRDRFDTYKYNLAKREQNFNYPSGLKTWME